MKKVLVLSLLSVLLLAVFSPVSAGNNLPKQMQSVEWGNSIPEELFLCMMDELPLDDSVAFMKGYAIPVPKLFGDDGCDLDAAAVFVKKAVDFYLSSGSPMIFSFTLMHDYSEAIANAAADHYKRARSSTPSATRGLVDSTIAYWNGDCHAYNCYAFALKKTNSVYNPGESVTGYESTLVTYLINHNVDGVASSVVTDLGNWNYSCVKKSNTCPSTSGLASGETLICVRLATDACDYHFMRYMPSASKWYHKPGRTAVLAFKYSPGYKIWSNEAFDGVNYYTGTVHYGTNIRYIVYRTTHANYTYTDVSATKHRQTCTRCGDISLKNHIMDPIAN
ncbi:MAG: hypothetical protein II536_02280, partial [Clostridia bacterium]|nr:hypothetical protein [Clostridia bacterium]